MAEQPQQLVQKLWNYCNILRDDALRQHAEDNEIVREEKTRFGTRYIIDGLLQAPDGRMLNVRAAWFIDNGSDVPRFITAHPLRRRRT